MKKDYYEIDDNVYRRFEQKNEMFCRHLWNAGQKNSENIWYAHPWDPQIIRDRTRHAVPGGGRH